MTTKKKTPAERRAERRTVLFNRFAALYVSNGRNATRAYMAIFPRARPNSAGANGHDWLRNTEVQEEIARLSAEAWKREHMTAEEVLGRMARIARIDIADFYWKPGELNREGNPTQTGHRKDLADLTPQQTECIKGFKFDITGRTIMELWDKPTQLANVGKHLKLLTDKLDVNLTTPLDKLIEKSYGENKE